jgi:hypothetical protein
MTSRDVIGSYANRFLVGGLPIDPDVSLAISRTPRPLYCWDSPYTSRKPSKNTLSPNVDCEHFQYFHSLTLHLVNAISTSFDSTAPLSWSYITLCYAWKKSTTYITMTVIFHIENGRTRPCLHAVNETQCLLLRNSWTNLFYQWVSVTACSAHHDGQDASHRTCISLAVLEKLPTREVTLHARSPDVNELTPATRDYSYTAHVP